MDTLDRPVEAESRLREKNQLTMPELVARVLEVASGDRLLWEVTPERPGVATVTVLPRDFAGSLTGVYGTAEEALEYVRSERAAWAE